MLRQEAENEVHAVIIHEAISVEVCFFAPFSFRYLPFARLRRVQQPLP